MKNRNGMIGDTITYFVSLIMIFVIMLIFVIVSSFISKDHSESYSLLDDFAGRYIQFNGGAISVGNAIEMTCKNESLESELRTTLTNYFADKYGSGNAFALVARLNAREVVPIGDNRDYHLYSSYGFFDEKIDQTKPIDFKRIGNYFEMYYPQQKSFCAGNKNLKLYVRSGGEI